MHSWIKSTRLLGLSAIFLTLCSPKPLSAEENSQENLYSQITELNSLQFEALFKEYAVEHQIGSTTTEDVVHFLEQFEDLESLYCGRFFSRYVDANQFMQNPPHLPHLKQLVIHDDFSAERLDWLSQYPSLESLTISDYDTIDLSPLNSLQHLVELELLFGEEDGSICHLDSLPASLSSLNLEEGSFDLSELNKLNLKNLSLNSRQLTQLPSKELLSKLEYLDISGSSVEDLSPLIGNDSLKGFAYSAPEGKGVLVDFSVLVSLPNLEEIELYEFPQDDKAFQDAVSRLHHLKKLWFSGESLSDVSYLKDLHLHELSIDGYLLKSLPESVLSDPSLIDLTIWGDEKGVLSTKKLSSNLQSLRLFDVEQYDFANLVHCPLTTLVCADVDCIKNPSYLAALAPTLEELVCLDSLICSFVKERGVESLTAFTKFKYLATYKEQKARSLPFSWLTKFPAIESIDISCTQNLPPQAFELFLEMKHLKHLDITGAPLEAYTQLNELVKKGILVD